MDIAFVTQDAATHDAAAATLGGARDRGALICLRFSVDLPPESTVLEAYVMLERVADIDADPNPVTLHTARIVDAWDSRSVSWAHQPRVEEIGAPVTRVSPAAGSIVRLDVRALVQRWRRRTGRDFGVAVRAEQGSVTGMVFALSPAGGGTSMAELGPRLELYVK